MKKKYILLFLSFLSVYGLQAREAFFLPSRSDKIMELLQEGKSFFEKENWDKAIDCYQTILEKHGDKIVEVEKGRYVNGTYMAFAALASMPEEAMKTYENKIGGKARMALKGTKESSCVSVPEVLQFLYTQEGSDALLRLISRTLFAEEYEKAILYLFYYQHYGKKKLPSEKISTIGRKALSYYALGEEHFLGYLHDLSKKENPETLLGNGESLETYIHGLMKNVRSRSFLLGHDASWPMYGKNLSRHFSSRQQISELEKSWSCWIESPAREKEQKTIFYNESPRHVKSPCPYYPIIAAGQVFINNGKDVFAYDLLSSKQTWHFQGLLTELKSERSEEAIHSVAYHRGHVYASLEGDTPTQSKENWSYFQIRKIIPERRLVKLDATTGHLVWKISDPEGDEESFANKASFTSSPVVWGDYLYAGATELTGIFNSYVVCIEPGQGKIVWKTLVGSAQQELNMFGRPVRESVGASITSGDGQLYYLTNLGACAAVDPLTGRLAWVYMYDRTPIHNPNEALFRTVYRKSCWHNSPVIVYKDCVYFAPIDSDHVYCLDAKTGEKKWSKFRDQHGYLLGVANDKVVLGGKRIEFVEAFTGTHCSFIPLGTEEVSGMGIVSGNQFYIPATRSLYCVNVEQEKLLQKLPWKEPEPPGHIILADSVLACTTPKELLIFYDWEKLSEKLQAQISKEPNDPSAYLKLADLYVKKGGQEEKFLLRAEKLYEKTISLSSSIKAVNKDFLVAQAERGLLNVYLQLARIRLAMGQEEEYRLYYTRALPLAKTGETAIPVLLRLHDYYRRARNLEEARGCLEQLISRYGEEFFFLPEKNEKVQIELYATLLLAQNYEESKNPGQAVDLYQKLLTHHPKKRYENMLVFQLAMQEINRLIGQFGRALYGKYDDEAQLLLRTLKKGEYNSAHLARIIEQYPNSRHTTGAFIEMTRLMIQEGRIRNSVEQLKLFLREYPDAPEKMEACYILVECYEKMKMHSAAKTILKQMQEEFQGKSFELDGRKIFVSKFVGEKLAEPIYAKNIGKNKQVLNLWEGDAPKHQFKDLDHAALRLIRPHGEQPTKYEHLLFFNAGRVLYCRHGESAEKLWTKDIGWIYGLGFSGEHLLAWKVNSLLRLDPETGDVIWEKNMPYRFVSMTLGKKVVAVLSYDYRQLRSTVRVKDSSTGNDIWSNDFQGRNPGDILLGNDTLIAHAKNPSSLYVYHLSDGKLVQPPQVIDEKGTSWLYYPIVSNESYLCLSSRERVLECYELPSLKPIWQYDVGALFIPSNTDKPLIEGCDSYVAYVALVMGNHEMRAMEFSTGEIKWKKPVSQAIYRVFPEEDNLYFLENKPDGIYLWALDAQDGGTKWTALLSRSYTGVHVTVTERYVIAVINRYMRGYQSRIMVFQKSNGQKMKDYEVNEGNRGRTYTEVMISGKNLWAVKDNVTWVMGK